ncbi:VpsP family polysaccharide biosynthesis protein [Salinibius halmophilus]|uniref:VpsP family polysaccharide biosynthesis protein n=1 Tax=Salinibius halmophilus TaxID=1853216 RepID=UPI000E66811A|nr:VpsP family polysaccharide biosynthesis protein [Salinibius halmophilus]
MVKRIGIVALAALTLVTIYLSWQWGTANLYYKKADYYLTYWQDGGDVEANIYQDAVDAINVALNRHPQHPHYLNVRAKIYQWGAFSNMADPAELLTAAKADFLRATELRPLWPITWMDLAQVEVDLAGGEFTEQAQAYFDQANEVGPYLHELLQTELALLTRVWPQLSTDYQQHYYQKVEAVKGNYKLIRFAFEDAKAKDRLRGICTFTLLDEDMQSVRDGWLYRNYCTG